MSGPRATSVRGPGAEAGTVVSCATAPDPIRGLVEPTP